MDDWYPFAELAGSVLCIDLFSPIPWIIAAFTVWGVFALGWIIRSYANN